MDIEYRITLADGSEFFLTVHVTKLGDDAHDHRTAINDGMVSALAQARGAAWWDRTSEFHKIEFWQVHTF